MAVDLFALEGSVTATPSVGTPSGSPVLDTPLDERMRIARDTKGRYDLTTTDPVTVSLAGLTSAHVVILRATGKVRARLTSADGTTQSVPCDPLLVLLSSSVPITAIDITRAGANPVSVEVYLAEKAADDAT